MELFEWLGEKNQLGQDIWKNKYCQNGESFDGWLDRVSGGNSEVAESIKNKKFIFGGRILSNRGLHLQGKKVTYSNCYVMSPPEDNIESIFDTAKKLARTFSYGGGCGIDISKLRPRGSAVNNTAKETSGAVSFMDLYNLTTEVIGQNGRRGALMLSIDVSHPDIEEFIKIKSDLGKIQKANISVKVTDEFMKAVIDDKVFKTSFIVEDTGENITKEVNAKRLFTELARQNWNYAEPGILFWDRINNWNLLSEDENFSYAGTNPCAEEPLPAGGSCLLGSLVLPSFTKEGRFDTESFRDHVRMAVRALNSVLDEGLGLHPLEEQRESVRDWRQIGLGVLGVGDLMIKLGIRYGSPESLELSHMIGHLLSETAIHESSLLAKEHGPYPMYNAEAVVSSPYYKSQIVRKAIDDDVKKYGLRNSQLLTVAPTGSIGTMLQISTGIEPNFAFSYERKTESLHDKDVHYKVFAKIAKDYMENNGINEEEDLPDYFVSAQNMDPIERVKMQAVWQRYIDASISSTVNLTNDVTAETVAMLYIYAHQSGLKGMTVYRAGCEREGILTTSLKKADNSSLKRGEFKKIAPDTIYYPQKLKIGCGKLKVMIGYSTAEDSIQDIYAIRSGQGGCEKNIQAVAIYMSGMLRLGGNLFMLEKSIEGISGCPSFSVQRGKGKTVSPGNTCSSALLYALKKFENQVGIEHLQDLPFKEKSEELVKDDHTLCPECGEKLDFTGGCISCQQCGFSKCEL